MTRGLDELFGVVIPTFMNIGIACTVGLVLLFVLLVKFFNK